MNARRPSAQAFRVPAIRSGAALRRPGVLTAGEPAILQRRGRIAAIEIGLSNGAPSKIARTSAMVIGFSKKLNQAFCHATLQPPFNESYTELSRLRVSRADVYERKHQNRPETTCG